VRRVRADPNFVRLPRRRYDAVWSSDGLEAVVNLEYLLDEIADALRADGLFAYRGWVGERRTALARARFDRVNAALAEVPARFRRDGVAAVTPGRMLATRTDEILPLVRERFAVVHEERAGALAPLLVQVDLPALVREAPEILARLREHEEDARRDPAIEPCLVYMVLRRRG
jgi:hypothetical protein